MPLTDTTRRRVRRNHQRVRSLIGLAGMMIHTAAEEDMGQDVLRAATVLLHASLDDFMRTVAKENWSSLSQERLKSVPLPSRKPGEKISFLDLLQLQGQVVDDVVREAVFTTLTEQALVRSTRSRTFSENSVFLILGRKPMV